MELILSYSGLLLDGAKITVMVSALSMLLAMVIGLGAAMAKLSGSRALRWLAEGYTGFIRGVPELVLLLLIFYGVPTLIQSIVEGLGNPDFRMSVEPFSFGIVTIGVIYGGYATEVFRGAMQTVPKGQLEAGYATGMTRRQVFLRIMLPQLWRFAIPGLGNVWLVLQKATALMAIINVQELMRSAQIAAGATKEPFTFYFAASLIFLLITTISMIALRYAERYANRGIRRAA